MAVSLTNPYTLNLTSLDPQVSASGLASPPKNQSSVSSRENRQLAASMLQLSKEPKNNQQELRNTVVKARNSGERRRDTIRAFSL